MFFSIPIYAAYTAGNGCPSTGSYVYNRTNETSQLLAYSCSCYSSCCVSYRSEWDLCFLTIECIHTGIQTCVGEYILRMSPVSSKKLSQVTVLKRICSLWLLQLVGSSHMLIHQSLD